MQSYLRDLPVQGHKIKGSMITAPRGNDAVTRNSTLFRIVIPPEFCYPIPPHPNVPVELNEGGSDPSQEEIIVDIPVCGRCRKRGRRQ